VEGPERETRRSELTGEAKREKAGKGEDEESGCIEKEVVEKRR